MAVRRLRLRRNPMDERIRRRMNGEQVWSLHGLDGNWIGDYDMGGAPRQQVIWFAGMPVGVIDRRRGGGRPGRRAAVLRRGRCARHPACRHRTGVRDQPLGQGRLALGADE